MPVSAVYSSSSVTELSDVSDAGSGIVITDAERASVNYMKNLLQSNGIQKLSTLLNDPTLNLNQLKNVVLISTDDGPQLYENDLVTLFVTFILMISSYVAEAGTIYDLITNERLFTFTTGASGPSHTITTRLGMVNLLTIGTRKAIIFKTDASVLIPLTINIPSTTNVTALVELVQKLVVAKRNREGIGVEATATMYVNTVSLLNSGDGLSIKDKFGFALGELNSAGFTLSDLKTSGFSARDITTLGFTTLELKAGGFTLAQLKAEGFTVADLYTVGGFTPIQLMRAGFTATDFNTGGLSFAVAYDGGFLQQELTDAGYTDFTAYTEDYYNDSTIQEAVNTWTLRDANSPTILETDPKHIRNWKTKNVTNMSMLFEDKHSSADISRWDTSSVTNMSYMFYGNHSFNSDIGGWDTSSVIDMSYMFSYAFSFNSDIGGWDTSSVTDMREIFASARDFSHLVGIGNWDFSNVTTFDNFIIYKNVSIQTYGAFLVNLSNNKTLQNNLNMGIISATRITDVAYTYFTDGVNVQDAYMYLTSPVPTGKNLIIKDEGMYPTQIIEEYILKQNTPEFVTVDTLGGSKTLSTGTTYLIADSGGVFNKAADGQYSTGEYEADQNYSLTINASQPGKMLKITRGICDVIDYGWDYFVITKVVDGTVIFTSESTLRTFEFDNIDSSIIITITSDNNAQSSGFSFFIEEVL